jgi:hypothetical protein
VKPKDRLLKPKDSITCIEMVLAQKAKIAQDMLNSSLFA